MDEERRLMGRVARGDEAAFTERVARCGGRRLGVARGLRGSRADAEDAVQRALLQCYLGAGTYRAEWAVSTWLYRILTNVCVDELRRRKSRSGELAPPPPSARAPRPPRPPSPASRPPPGAGRRAPRGAGAPPPALRGRPLERTA